LNYVADVLLVSLEEDTNDLSEVKLELVFILVLFLEHKEVFLVEKIFLGTSHVFFLVFVVLLDSVFRLSDEVEDSFCELVNAGWLEKIVSCLINEFFKSLSLADQTISLGFRLHSINDVV